jgi:DNA-binding transcriptional LysR family regulator
MKLNQLIEMVTIVERGSLRAAARHLDTPQPGITRNIRALEKEMGAPLFERASTGMVLTPMGRLLHRRASVVVNEVRRAREDFAQAQGDMRGTVVAGLSILPHIRLLPHALPRFRARYPRVRLKIIEGLYPAIEPRLREGTVDFYLGASPDAPPAPGLQREVIFTNRRIIAGRKGHTLLGAKSLRDLARADWATATIDVTGEEDLNSLFAKHRLPPPSIMLQCDSGLSVIVAVMHSDLLVMLPAQWADFALTKEVIKVIDVKEKMAAPSLAVVRRADLPLTPAAEYFCDLMRRYPVDAARK